MEVYRHVKIAGEDIVEEEALPEIDAALEGVPGYDYEARSIYTGCRKESAKPVWRSRSPFFRTAGRLVLWGAPQILLDLRHGGGGTILACESNGDRVCWQWRGL